MGYAAISSALWAATPPSGFPGGMRAIAFALLASSFAAGLILFASLHRIIGYSMSATLIAISFIVLVSPLPPAVFGAGSGLIGALQPGARFFAVPVLAGAILMNTIRQPKRPVE